MTRASAQPRSNLPAPLTRFVGRERELERLDRERAAGRRLLTILGPPGSGKTRLAMEHGRRVLRGSDRSVWFVDLSAAREVDGDEMARQAGRVLALRTPGGHRGRRFQARIGALLPLRCPMLLVLDGAEHLTSDACAALMGWLNATEGLDVLAASARRLGIAGECLVELGPLPLSEQDAQTTEGTAVELFVDRATNVRGPDAQPLEPKDVSAICRGLDGLPLAIELAASRLRVMSVRQLHEWLEDDAQEVGPLDRAIERSWSLLAPADRRALAASSIFRGGFDLVAAEAVLEVEGLELAVARIQSLRDSSLVTAAEGRQETAGTVRFHMLRCIREFARRKLEADPELHRQAQERHRDHYTRVAEEMLDAIDTPEEDAVRARVHEDLENLRDAHAFAMSCPSAPGAVRSGLSTAAAVGAVLAESGPLEEPLAMLTRALEEGGGGPQASPDACARAWLMLGLLRQYTGTAEEARTGFEHALEAAQAAGAPVLESQARERLGRTMLQLGRPGAARRCFREAQSLARRAGRPGTEARALSGLALLEASRGDAVRGLPRLERVVELTRQEGLDRQQARALFDLGWCELQLGELVQAEHHLTRSLELCVHGANTTLEGAALRLKGLVLQERGRLGQAMECYAAARLNIAMLGQPSDEAFVWAMQGEVHRLEGRLARAEECFERALSCTASVQQNGFEALVCGYRAILRAGDARFEAAARDLQRAAEIVPTLPRESRWWQRSVWELQEATVEVLRDGRPGAREASAARERARERLRAVRSRPQARTMARSSRVPWIHQSALIRLAANVLADTLEDGAPGPRLVIMDDTRRVQLPDGTVVDLSRRGPTRRVLTRILREHQEARGRTASVEALFEAGWAGQSAQPSSAAARVYVAIHALRKLGLAPYLQRLDTGYRLDPELTVVRPDPAAPDEGSGDEGSGVEGSGDGGSGDGGSG